MDDVAFAGRPAHAAVVALVAALVPATLLPGAEPHPPSTPLPPPAAGKSSITGEAPLFESLPPEQSGLRHVLPIDIRHPLKRLYVSAFGCGGIAAGDVDGDDRPDLYFVDGPGPNRLYRQTEQSFVFEDVTDSAGGVDGGDAWGGGAAMVDIEGDGDLDIFVCNYEAPCQLYVNDGRGRFVEDARAFSLDRTGAFLMAAFADYDRDGDLDVYLLGHRFYREGGRPSGAKVSVVKDGRPVMLPEYDRYYRITLREAKRWEVNNCGAPDLLLRNDGGRFVDATAGAGLPHDRWQGNSVAWWDYNADGWPDLYVANDFEDPDCFYRNNGNGTFTDVTREQLPHTTWFSMGTDAADIDNDGRIDLLSLDMAGTTHYKSKTTMGAMGANNDFMLTADPPQFMRNCLYWNTGTSRFAEIAFLAGTAYSDWSWAAKFGDLDCDGRVDLFISNGMTRNFNDSDNPLDVEKLVGQTEWELYEDTPARPEVNLAFRNAGDLKFSEAGPEWGLAHNGMSYGAAWADFDRDGRLDLVVANLEEPPSLYRNRGTSGSRIALALDGAGGNRFAIGARVEVRTASGLQVRELHPMRGFSSSDEPLVQVGLGEDAAIERLTVRWPSGRESVFTDLPADRRYAITEPGDAPVAMERALPDAAGRGGDGDAAAGSPALFTRRDDVFGDAAHWEPPFDDFALQPLLPNSLSRFGPGLAAADIDGDGDLDFFLGGSAGQLGQLLVNDGRGGFASVPFEAARLDRACEDMGAVFLDADADGDPDLFVVSGSIEAPEGDESYVDRLYVNDGTGGFRKARPGMVPDLRESGSCAVACDFDRDGDLDLFVGGRVVPGDFPIAPSSRLLVNNGKGGFTDGTESIAPELARAGLVTAAVWTDVDGDAWQDLLVATEWGPVRLYRNASGDGLREATAESGLAGVTGWWNGIAAADVDADGDVDFAATNFGLNTKYKASHDEPELLFYGEFDSSGKRQLVEAGYEDGTCFPHRGYSCSSRAMPFLKDKLKSYHAFASTELVGLYSEERLDEALRLEANTLESGVFLNDGSGRFSFRALPREAQVSPAFGCAFEDIDLDGVLDLVLVHNFFGPQIETRPMDTGLGLLLTGGGDGTFRPVPPDRSGIVVPEDAKALVIGDVDGDALPDLVVSCNDGPLIALTRRSSSGGDPVSAGAPAAVVTVGLAAKAAGNRSGIGGRLAFVPAAADPRLPTQVREIAAGAGYLSQGPPDARFAVPPGGGTVTVTWPDGTSSRHRLESPPAVDPGSVRPPVIIRQP